MKATDLLLWRHARSHPLLWRHLPIALLLLRRHLPIALLLLRRHLAITLLLLRRHLAIPLLLLWRHLPIALLLLRRPTHALRRHAWSHPLLWRHLPVPSLLLLLLRLLLHPRLHAQPSHLQLRHHGVAARKSLRPECSSRSRLG